MSRTIDFDAFRAEQKAEPVSLTIGGKTYELPTSLPATLALDVIRMNAAGAKTEIKAESLEQMGIALFGGTTFREVISEHKIGMDELPDLIRLVLQAYNLAAGNEEKDAAPNPPARRPRASKKSPTTS